MAVARELVQPRPATPAEGRAAPGLAPQGAGGVAGVTCGKCGQTVAGGKFCAECGANLAPPGPRFCPGCGQPWTAGAKFCSGCGTSINA
jgi:hypothetical protein